MPRKAANNATPVALPTLDAISSIESSALPEPTNRTALTDDEIAIAKAIIAAGSDGKYAVGPKLADKPAAAAAAQRVRRLLGAYWKSLGTPTAERPSISSRMIPKDGGTAWALTLGAPKPATSTPADGAATAAAVASAT